MINLSHLLAPAQQSPLYSFEALPVYIGNAFNTMFQDLNTTYPGSEPFQYTNRYGGTYFYLYGPTSESGDKLTEEQVKQIIE